MSLSRNQEENNYWPSISDMFLVFFVLTLALLATEREAGDKFIQDDLIYEAGKLVEHANSDDLQQAKGVTIAWPDVPKEDMEGVAIAMRECRKWLVEKIGSNAASEKFIAEDAESYLEVTEQNSREVMGCNIKAMYLMLELGQDTNPPDLYYDKMLREINLALSKGSGGSTPEQRVKELEQQLQLKKEEVTRLYARINDLKKMISVLQDEKGDTGELIAKVAELERELKEKDQKIASLQEQNSNLSSQNTELAGQLSERDAAINEMGDIIARITKNSRVSTIVMGEKDVNFDKGCYDDSDGHCRINQERFNALIAEIQSKLKGTEDKWIVEVIGHTDPSGGDDVNALLGLQRAQFFKKKIAEFIRNSADRDRLIFRTYSAASSDPRGSYSDSRRIEVIIRPEKQVAEQ